MRRRVILFCAAAMLLLGACDRKLPHPAREVVAEIGDSYLYEDELQQFIPVGLHQDDSTTLADAYIRKWATEILMYEKAKQNISDMSEINRLVEEYRKTLTIHQYQQRLLEQRNAEQVDEADVKRFYDEYTLQMTAKENMLKGIFLVVPADAPHMADVREWVRKADEESIENLDKYSLVNAVGYDYFMDKWYPLSKIIRRAPFQITNPKKFLSAGSMVEVSDSTHRYFLKISEFCAVGQIEPYDLARSRIVNILTAKQGGEIVSEIERELYEDAISSKELKIYK